MFTDHDTRRQLVREHRDALMHEMRRARGPQTRECRRPRIPRWIGAVPVPRRGAGHRAPAYDS